MGKKTNQNEDSVDASIQWLEDYIKKSKKKTYHSE